MVLIQYCACDRVLILLVAKVMLVFHVHILPFVFQIRFKRVYRIAAGSALAEVIPEFGDSVAEEFCSQSSGGLML